MTSLADTIRAGAVNDSNRAAAVELMERGRYAAAARTVAEARSGEVERRLDRRPRAAEAEAEPVPVPVSGLRASLARIVTNTLPGRDPLPGLAGDRLMSALGLFRAQLTRSVLVAAVIAAATYVLYASAFDGTVAQMLGLFLYGLTIDFTVQSALDLAGAGRIPQEPPKP